MKTITVLFSVIILLLMVGISATAQCIEIESTRYPLASNRNINLYSNFVVVDTGQNTCFDNSDEISFPDPGES
ncbi:unnamed protein product, partial [marine sediment metagenome]